MSHWVAVAWLNGRRSESATFDDIEIWPAKDALIVEMEKLTLVIFEGYLFAGPLEIYVREAKPQDGIFFYVYYDNNNKKGSFYGMSIYGWKEERWVGLEKETCNEFKKFISWLAEVHRQLRSIDIDCENLTQ